MKRSVVRLLPGIHQAALCVSAVLALGGCASVLLGPGYPRRDGTIRGLPLESRVEVIRDAWGIPHIYAQSSLDLMTAQGYVHAQDRLWQMELLRRLSQGRLAEIVGEAAVLSDYFVRLIGFPDLVRREAAGVSAEDRRLAQAYANGVNAYLETRRKGESPIELRLLGLTPQPWTTEDAYSALAAVSWFFLANYTTEILAIKARAKLTRSEWDLLFPSHPGAILPSDEYFESLRALSIAPFLEAALAFYDSFFGSSGGGSNAWVVANGQDGMPLLANDTHMTLMVPNIWYVCHLDSPEMRVAGFSLPGSPGVFIGHNEHVAWGFTSLGLDAQDLYVLETDPEDPTRYRVGDEWLTMERRVIVIDLPRGRQRVMTAYRTTFGPVITDPEQGGGAAVALRWYGSLDDGRLSDNSTGGFLGLAQARNTEQAMDAGSRFAYLGQNMIVAGTDGHIAYHALGAVPIRTGYSGRLPAFGSQGNMDWSGFATYGQMPGSVDPARGWLVTANNRVAAFGEAQPISYSWSEPYRLGRISQLLSGHATPAPEDFAALQMDVHSRFADTVLDKVIAYPSSEPRAALARDILRAWDREVTTSSTGALVFEVFVVEWVKALLEDELGSDFDLYLETWPSTYSVEDVILDHPDSPLWDRRDTPAPEGPAEILDLALVRAMTFLQERLGNDRRAWSWGRLHTVAFEHPAGRGLLGGLLNPKQGRFPAPGSLTTVNVGGYLPGDSGYRVVGIPNMRMVVPLGNLDRTLVVSPPGQSGVPSHPHYDDMIGPWREGASVPLPFSRAAVDKAAADILWLEPPM